VALYGREYLVAVKPQEHGMVMYTLHHAAELRGIDQIEELGSVPKTVKPEELKLAQQVVEMYSGELNLDDYKDEYKEELRRVISAKVAGEEVVAAEVPEAPSNVVDLMAALRKSLDAVSASKKPTAKADLPKKAPAAKAEPRRKRA
jgi:DNA end-binding protein Ku